MDEAELIAQGLHDDRQERIAALKAENTRQAAEVERLRAELACAQESVAAAQGLLRDARAKNTPLRELLRRAVDGLSKGACYTCGAEPGCNIDCLGCRWIAEAEAVLADAHMSGSSLDHARLKFIEEHNFGAFEALRSRALAAEAERDEALREELANHLLYVHPLPWRVGRKVARNVYDAGSEGVAMFMHAYTAAIVVEAVNRLTPRARAALSGSPPISGEGEAAAEPDCDCNWTGPGNERRCCMEPKEGGGCDCICHVDSTSQKGSGR